jgi:hypothetical protein
MTSRTRIFTALGACAFAVACQQRSLTAPHALGLNAAKQVVAGEIPSTFAAAIALDTINQTITLPLYRGTGPRGERVFFILTESSDFGLAVKLGINWSPKLVNALGTGAVQRVRGVGTLDPTTSDVHFSGGVTFGLGRNVVPGPDGFPLDPATTPGSIGDANYSPLITNGNGIVWNAEQIANGTGVHGKVISIDYARMQVTLRLTHGFYTHHNVLYLSTDASKPDIAALENATYAPNLDAAPTAGNDDPAVSAREPIIPIVNGPLGAANPERQGLRSAVAGEGDPLNIIREEPECSNPNDPAVCSALQYSPLWDVHPVLWTDAAIAQGTRRRVTDHQDVEAFFNAGAIVSAAPGGPSNQDPEIKGLRAAGVVVNCPPMFVSHNVLPQ